MLWLSMVQSEVVSAFTKVYVQRNKATYSIMLVSDVLFVPSQSHQKLQSGIG